MSAGRFDRAFYTTNDGNVVSIRLQPETRTMLIGSTANTGPAGPATSGFPSAVVSRSRRSIGIHPRTITIQFVLGSQPPGYKAEQTYTIPVLSETVWEGASDGTAVTYLDLAATVINKSPEIIN